MHVVNKEEMMKQLDAKMKESQLLKTMTEHEITIGLLIVPQASIPHVVPVIVIVLGEGTSQEKGIEQQDLLSQALTLTIAPSHEQVTIHNIESL